MKRYICLILYYSIAKYLPSSFTPILGNLCKQIRYLLCQNIFYKCGYNVNIEKGAYFGSGKGIIIGNNSGLGKNCKVPSHITIGNDVMMGPNCTILYNNHKYDSVDIPMRLQGVTTPLPVTIEDDVWIGQDVLITPGRIIKKGTIIAARCCLTKDFPPYSIVGGVPCKILKMRK